MESLPGWEHLRTWAMGPPTDVMPTLAEPNGNAAVIERVVSEAASTMGKKVAQFLQQSGRFSEQQVSQAETSMTEVFRKRVCEELGRMTQASTDTAIQSPSVILDTNLMGLHRPDQYGRVGVEFRSALIDRVPPRSGGAEHSHKVLVDTGLLRDYLCLSANNNQRDHSSSGQGGPLQSSAWGAYYTAESPQVLCDTPSAAPSADLKHTDVDLEQQANVSGLLLDTTHKVSDYVTSWYQKKHPLDSSVSEALKSTISRVCTDVISPFLLKQRPSGDASLNAHSARILPSILFYDNQTGRLRFKIRGRLFSTAESNLGRLPGNDTLVTTDGRYALTLTPRYHVKILPLSRGESGWACDVTVEDEDGAGVTVSEGIVCPGRIPWVE